MIARELQRALDALLGGALDSLEVDLELSTDELNRDRERYNHAYKLLKNALDPEKASLQEKYAMLPDFVLDHVYVQAELNRNGSYTPATPETPTTAAKATLVTSKIRGTDQHRPVLDIDFRAALLPSSQAGHFHLYLDQSMKTEEYFKFLHKLAKFQIIEYGYAEASHARGFSAVRVPWLRKPGT